MTGHSAQYQVDGSRPGAGVLAALVAVLLLPVVGLTIPGAGASVSDVPPGHPFETEIGWMLDEGITTGYPDGTFRPSASITRQSMAAFLWRLAGEPAPTGSSSFPDVPPTHPFRDAIDWMVGAGITTGYPDGTFRPTATITRQSAAAFLHRFAGEPTPAGSSSFPDVPPTHPFRDAIDWMVAADITTGYPDGTFRPTASLTRQSSAAFLYRLAGNPSAWDDDAQPLGVDPPSPGDAVDCTDFATWAEAQAWFDWFAALGDPADLDPDHDGIACEGLPGAPSAGTPDPAFNGGDPVALDSWLFDTHQVVHLGDGSTLVGRGEPVENTVTRLRPDGTVDTGWGDAGNAPVSFVGSAFSSGFDEGVEQVDGSVVLYGWSGPYTFGTVRLTPEGDVDTSYGDDGRVSFDTFFGPAPDLCSLTATGGLVCATASVTSVTLETFDADGNATGTQETTIDLSPFEPPVPGDLVGTVASTQQWAFTQAVERAGGGTVVVISTGARFLDADGFYIAASESEEVVVRITPLGLDTSFGAGGYRNVDLEPADVEAPGTDWGSYTLALDVAPTSGAVTMLVTVTDSVGSGESRSAIVRLTGGGAFDTGWGGDGITVVRDAGGDPVAGQDLATRDGAQTTVIAEVGEPPTGGVVLRYLADGTLDPDFSDDGEATVPGAELLSGLDLRNGRVTVGGRSGPTSLSGPYADALVAVLFG